MPKPEYPKKVWVYDAEDKVIGDGGRSRALDKIFNNLDYEKKGYISNRDFKKLVSLASKACREEDVSFLPPDEPPCQEEIAYADFATYFEQLFEGASETQCELAVKDMTYMDFTADYKHPAENRQYLSRHVLPTLSKGMEELVKLLQGETVKMNSWQEFPTGHLPDKYIPEQPLLWLAEWLESNNPNNKYIVGPRNWTDLSREEKLELCFKHLDRDNSGFLTQNELLAIASKLNPIADIAEAKKTLEFMDSDGDNKVSLAEYLEAMVFLLSTLEAEQFEAKIHEMLAATHLSYFSREEKVMMAFRHLDVNNNGLLELEEIILLGQKLNPKTDEEAARKTIHMMDLDGDHQVNGHEFSVCMLKMTESLTEEQFDMGIHKLLTAKQPEPETPNPLEGLGVKLSKMAQSLPSFTLARQMGIVELQTRLAESKVTDIPVVLIDTRTVAEYDTSHIEGSLRMHMQVYDADQMLSDADDIAAYFCLEGQEKEAEERIGKITKPRPRKKGDPPLPPRRIETISEKAIVVAYDTCGVRGGMGAIALEKTLGINVFNLTGGIVQWFNCGLPVANKDGIKVKTLHPGIKRCLGYINAPNDFNDMASLKISM